MSEKPTAAWYLAPIFLGIIGSGIMWYVLKDEDHQDAPKMVKKGLDNRNCSYFDQFDMDSTDANSVCTLVESKLFF